ncbi:MAG: carboxylate-amine ligase [Thermoleophilaceae bacterium]
MSAGETGTPSATAVRVTFDAPAPMTVGFEEELMLLDPATLDLSPQAHAVIDRVAGDERFKLELPATQLEIVSPPLPSAAEAATFLAAARHDLAAATDGLVRLGCAGVHPFAAAEGELNSGERYSQTLERYGRIARRQLVFGLQVHVAVRGAERALAVYNAMRSYLPELLAMSANAPFYLGEDSGLATVRPKLCELLPRQGVPPEIPSWEAYCAALRWGARAGGVPEPRMWWWELRPHPLFGTLELRVPDAQTTVAEVTGVVTVAHALAAWLAARHDAGERLPVAPTWRIAENRWAALRAGLDAELADLETGEREPARERLLRLLGQLDGTAVRLGCGSELDHARALVAENGAVRQREQARAEGMRGLVRWLSECYAAPFPGQA